MFFLVSTMSLFSWSNVTNYWWHMSLKSVRAPTVIGDKCHWSLCVHAQLLVTCWSINKISKHLNIHRGTVRTWIKRNNTDDKIRKKDKVTDLQCRMMRKNIKQGSSLRREAKKFKISHSLVYKKSEELYVWIEILQSKSENYKKKYHKV